MKIKGILETGKLEEAISASSLDLERAGVLPNERLVFRLTFEEILLLFNEALDTGTCFIVHTKKQRGCYFLTLSIEGREADPFAMDSPILKRLLDSTENTPKWEYRGGKNIVSFSFPLYNTLWNNISFAWKYVGKQRGILIMSTVIQLISVILGVIAPVLSARIIVQSMNDNVRRVIAIAIVLAVVQLVKNLLLVISNKGYNKVVCETLSVLESDLVMGALGIRNKCLEERGSGLFIQRLTGDTVRMASGFGRIADMTAQAVNYIGILLAMLYINFWVFLLTLSLLIAESMIEIYRTRKLYADDRIFRSANEKFSGFVGEMIRGVKDVKQLGAEKAFCNEAKKRVGDANDKRLIMQGNNWTIKLVRWEVSELGSLIFITLLAVFMGRGIIPVSTLIVLYNYYMSLDVRAVTLAGEFLEYAKDFSLSVERVCAILHGPEFPKERFGNQELKDPKGGISFEDVTFGYDSKDPVLKKRNVLEHFDLKVSPGEMVAIVGKSGCGKTTVLNLLCRLYDPDKGRVSLDGTDIRSLTKASLRSAITVVNQNPYIFNMSVKDNLRIAKSDMTDEEMREVCRLASIDADIEKMSDGYDTIIGEGGVNLSGGQRQRLAIARSLLQDYRIIIFDEATSALDNVTQSEIQKAIDLIKKERTVILIAHRLSTVIHSDRILYMSDGRILDEGSHEELLEKCEPYRLLYQEEGV